MAEKTTVDAVGPIAVQLKEKLSSLDRAQITGIKNVGATVSQRPGQIRGDISQSVSRITASQKSAMEIGANLASKLERSGAVGRVAAQAVGPAINTTVYDKTPLPQKFPELPVDLSLKNNRLPDPHPKSPYEKIKKKKESLVGEADLNYGGLQYPPDLIANAAAYVKLQFHTYQRGSPFAQGTLAPNVIINLPIPENLNVHHTVRFEERDTGALGELAQGATGAAIASNVQKMATGDLEANFQNLVGGVDGAQAARDAAAVAKNAAFSKLMDSEPVLGGLAGRISGVVPNPHPTVFFKGLDLREFQWSWKFVPRSEMEAATLDAVLRIIKQKVLPKNGGTFLDYPDLLKPKVMPESGVWGSFKMAAIKQFSINFSGEGTSAFFVNGKPVSVLCNMTFQEIEGFYQGDA